MLAVANGCSRPLCRTGAAGYTCAHDKATGECRRCPANRQGWRHRVPVRAVRRHARQAERQARPSPSPRRTARGRGRLCRLCGRRHRPGPRRSRHRRNPRSADAHGATLAAQRGPVRLRRHGRGPGLAILPAHDPAPLPGPCRRAGLRVQDRRRARVLPAAALRRRRDRARRSARHAGPALLRHAGADPQSGFRLPDLARRHGPRLGQLRHRPRGRQRPVRAELPVRRRADDVRPGCVLSLHGGVAGPAARADRHLHAQAVRASDRQRVSLPCQPVARRGEPVRSQSGRGSPRAGPVRARLPVRRRPEGQRQGIHRRDRADRQLV